MPALLDLQVKRVPRILGRDGSKFLVVFLKESFHLGIRAKKLRSWFWKALLQVLWKNPAALESFAFDVSVFHHLQQHVHYVQREISRYLSAPCEDDVLDQVSPPVFHLPAKPSRWKEAGQRKIDNGEAPCANPRSTPAASYPTESPNYPFGR